MEEIFRKNIDWNRTGQNLLLLRTHNFELRRYCCWKLRHNLGHCNVDCMNCFFEMDPSISRSELAQVFNVSENMILNWEKGNSKPTIEDLLLYADICKIDLFKIIIFA